MEMTAYFQEIALAAGPAAVAALWQSAALAFALALCLRLAPRMAAADRFKVWAAGFAAVALLPCLPFVALVLFPSANTMPQTAAVHPWFQLDARWSLAIAAVWLSASLYNAVDLGIHSLRLRKLWSSAKPLDLPDALRAQLATGRRPVEVCTTQELDRPSAIGFFRPRILIPDWLASRMTAAELEQVILHESEHLRRRDDWTNLAQKLCVAAFPLNPALLWIERRLCREREIACDEAVVSRTQSPRAYAACLTSLAERGLEHRVAALSLGAWQRRPELADRVHRILRRAPALSPAAAKALFAATICGLAAGSIELARCPQLVAFVARPVHAEVASAAVHAPVMPVRKPAVVTARNEKQPQILHSAEKRSVQNDSLSGKHNDANVETASSEGTDAVIREPQPTQSAQQWLVVTTWQQIEPSTAGDAPRITVQRQILLVAPNASNSKSTSTPVPPAAIPLPDGWLVLQL